jgi:hypothetical protein
MRLDSLKLMVQDGHSVTHRRGSQKKKKKIEKDRDSWTGSFKGAPTPSHLLPPSSRFLRYHKRYNNRGPAYLCHQGPGIQIIIIISSWLRSECESGYSSIPRFGFKN